MRKTFLVYCMGIVTFSITSRTYAQSDSALLTLHFVAPSYGYSFTTTVTNRYGDTLPGTFHSGAVSLYFDTAITIAMKDSINIGSGVNQFGSSNIGFLIDSAAGLLRNLSFQSSGVDSSTGYAGQSGVGGWTYTVKIDSVAFKRVASAILVSPSVIESSYSSWMALWGSASNFWYTELGGENGGGIQEDTLSMELSPAVSSVFSAKTLKPQEFSIAMDGEGFSIATFSPKPMERQLDLVSLLGSKMISIPIYSECSSMQLPEAILPPGLYFARLGNEIAKFIVMQ